MPRKNLIRTDQFPYHVTNRSNNKEVFPLELEDLWPIFIKTLAETRIKYPFELYCFVLMNNHYHLLIQTPELNLDKIMHNFNLKLSKKIAQKSGRINRIFGARYKWSLVNTNEYFSNVYKYIYQNPLRAGIVDCVEAYPYSSMMKSLRKWKLYDENLVGADMRSLNLTFDEKERLAIQKGLMKTIYKPAYERRY